MIDKATIALEQGVMWELIKTVLLHPPRSTVIDAVLRRCARPIFFEHGLSIVHLANTAAQRDFREALIHTGAFLEAIRLAALLGSPLTREEIVQLGNNHSGGILKEHAEALMKYAFASGALLPLDLYRLKKQLFAHAG